jgi:hypothetical protein
MTTENACGSCSQHERIERLIAERNELALQWEFDRRRFAGIEVERQALLDEIARYRARLAAVRGLLDKKDRYGAAVYRVSAADLEQALTTLPTSSG